MNLTPVVTMFENGPDPIACIILASIWKQRIKFLNRYKVHLKTTQYYEVLSRSGYIESPISVPTSSAIATHFITDKGKAYIHEHLLTALIEAPLSVLDALILEGDRIRILPASKARPPAWAIEGVAPPVGEFKVCELRRSFSSWRATDSLLVVTSVNSDTKYVLNTKLTRGHLLLPDNTSSASEIESRILKPKSLPRFLAYAKRTYKLSSLTLIELSNCFHKASAALS